MLSPSVRVTFHVSRFTFHVSRRSARHSGNVLFITLILGGILGFTLSSYLLWVRSQNMMVSESQAWNAAIAVAEAGIEEGMAQINVMAGSSGSVPGGSSMSWQATNFLPSISSNSAVWPYSGSAYGPRTNNLLRGSYSVTITPGSPGPTITSSGYTTVPYVGKQILRTVRVTTTTASLFGHAIAALLNVNMSGNNIYVDGYDSSLTNLFPGGLYNSTNAQAWGDVASVGGILNVGNANIHGRLILAPGASYNTLGPNGYVGDMSWTGPQIESPTANWVITDWNADFADVVAPYSGGLPPGPGQSTNEWSLPGGNYYVLGDLAINNNKTLYVGGNSTLYITGNLNGAPNSMITIAPGATLKLYVGQATGSTVGISFGQVNNGGNAYNFQVYGLPTCTSFTLTGNGAYIGTIYGPEMVFGLSGGGNNTLDFQGAIVVQSVSMNGHFHFHYDKNLSRTGPPSGYTVASWQEL